MSTKLYTINPDRDKPWNDLPPLPIDEKLYKTTQILERLGDAKSALGKLQGRAVVIPNQGLLINSISLQEAKASSEIENIFTTDDELYKAYSEQNIKESQGAAKEVLHYREALWSGFNYLKKKQKFNKEYFIKLFREIKQTSAGIRPPFAQITIRQGGYGPIAGQTIYTPPRGEGIIENKLDNLIGFLNNDEKFRIDPLLKMAISHYQMEAIHPFSDGNGRTGRILNLLMLIDKGLLTHPVLYLSKYIIDNKDDYYTNLQGVTGRNAWEKWILYMLTAVDETARFTIQKIEEISGQMNATLAYVNQELPHIDKEVIEAMFTQPYIRGEHIIGPKIKSRNTASKYLNQLGDIGVLEPKKIGREMVFINNDLMNILSGD